MQPSHTIVIAALVLAACSDTNVPFYTAPTVLPNTPAGVTTALTGLVSASRLDLGGAQGLFMFDMAGYARQAANYTNTEPRFITYILGLAPIPPQGWPAVWALSYGEILQSHQIIAMIPNANPTFTPQQAAALTGITQTLEAYDYIVVAEDHDTLGAAVLPQNPGTTPPPAYCIKDVWKYIVALLDSANANLNMAGATSLKFAQLPPGFAAVSAVAGPSTVAGSFASFNRALAGRAGLELAYAIARSSPATTPSETSPGQPDIAALTAADSAMSHSALFDPAALAPNPTDGWNADAHSVFFDFSAQSGDQTNPMNGVIGTMVVLKNVPDAQDTINDLRWKAKFIVNPNQVQQQAFDSVVSPYIYDMYPSPASFLPIVRDEGLTLTEAQIQLGLGNFGAAATLVNNVRTQVGGLAPATIPNTYVGTRDALLHEQQISSFLEALGDRTVAIRMYKLEKALLTTWGVQDLHTTIDPIPGTELAGRGGTFTKTCP